MHGTARQRFGVRLSSAAFWSARKDLVILKHYTSCLHGQQPSTPALVPLTPSTFTEHRWQAQWIWGHKLPHEHAGFFRREFVVQDGLVSAWAQMSGDDGYTLFVNTRQAAEGGFWWKKTDRLDITALLHEGTNVVAAQALVVLGQKASPCYGLTPAFRSKARVKIEALFA